VDEGAVGEGYKVLTAQGEHPARLGTVIVGADLAGVDRQCAGMDEHAATGAEAAGIADIEFGAALDVNGPKIGHRQSGRIAWIDRHLAGAGNAGHMNRAGGCREGGAGGCGR